MSRSGLEKRASTEAAWADEGVRARRLVGRRERGSADVGMDSGTSADMVVCACVCVCVCLRAMDGLDGIGFGLI